MKRSYCGISIAALLYAAPVLCAAAAPPTYTFTPSGHDCGGGVSSITADPFAAGRLICGGDIWGLHRSVDFGRSWTPVNGPASGVNYFSHAYNYCIASVKFSAKTPNRVYACAGNIGANGGFLRSDNAGDTWQLKSTVPQFSGNNNASTPLVQKGHPRSVGNLIALDATQTSEYVYVGTFRQGVMRSTGADPGASWSMISLPGLTNSNSFVRGLAIDDADPQTIYVAVYDTDSDGTNESIYKITGARTAASAALVAGTPFARAEEVVVINGVLHVAANTDGVWKYDNSTWTKLYSDSTPSCFYSIDGFWDSTTSKAVIFAGTTDQARAVGGGTSLYYSLIRSKDSGSSWTCLTADVSKIHLNMPMGDAGGDIWWNSNSWGELLGGTSEDICQIVLDPTDSTHKRLYLAARTSPWRSDDAVTVNNPTWYPIPRYLQSCITQGVAVDASHPNRVFALDYDWDLMSSTDGLSHMKQTDAGLPGGSEWAVTVDSTTNPGANGTAYLAKDDKVFSHTNPPSGSNWTQIFSGHGNAKGISVKQNAADGTVCLVACQDTGIWRKIGPGNNGTWSNVYAAGNVMRNLASDTKKVVFSTGGSDAPRLVYFFDRDNGVFRSQDAGLSWTKLTDQGWCNNSGSWSRPYCGWVAVDPTNPNNCYVTSMRGVWFSNNANTGGQPSWTKITPTSLGSALPGCVKFDDEGNAYLYVLVNGSTSQKILYKAAGDSTWHTIADGNDRVFRSLSYMVWEMDISPGPAHTIYLANNLMGLAIGKKQKTDSHTPYWPGYR